MDKSKIKTVLHSIVSIGGNLLVIGAIPVEYKSIALLAFNVVQVLYAYFDETYTIQKYGMARR